MAQHDYVIANGTGAAVRSDLNNGLAAIVTQNSGATEPTTTYAFMRWADTTAGVMKMRNSANSAWITLYQLDGEWTNIAFENGTAAAPSIYFKDSGTDTGFYSPGANQVGISTGGTAALVIDSSQRVGLGTSSPSSLLHLSVATAASDGTKGVRISNPAGTTAVFECGSSNDSYVGTTSASDFSIRTNNTARICVLNGGNVGIGTTSPSQLLHLAKSDASDTYIRFQNSNNSTFLAGLQGSSGDFLLFSSGAKPIRFGISDTEVGRWDSSGRLLVGTSSSVPVGGGTDGIFQVVGVRASFAKYSDDAFGSVLSLGKSRGTSPGSFTVVNSGDSLGILQFAGADGTDLQTEGARIEAVVDGTPGSNDLPTRLVFSTTADGASSPTERMRISNNGSVGIGVTDPAAGASATSGVAFRPGSHDVWFNHANGVASGTVYAYFTYNSGSIGSISQNGTTAVAYNTTSDYRLKENIVPLTGAADRVNQLEVRRFNFIAEPDRVVDGFIAHEVQAVVPEAITGEKDAVDDDGKPIYQGIDQSKLVPLLTAALQEALAEIESLKARVTALEP